MSTPLAIDAPALVVRPSGAVLLGPDGEIESLSHRQAGELVSIKPVIICHAPAVARRLGLTASWATGLPLALDVLELFAFTRPAQFCLPTPGGLARALALPAAGDGAEADALVLHQAASALLRQLASPSLVGRPTAQRLAATMARAGWSWGGAVCAALGEPERMGGPAGGLDVWTGLPEWQERGPPPPPGDQPVSGAETRARLAALIGPGRENRPTQADYAAAASFAFLPRESEGAPNLVLAEAGTGVGKTLGYIAPASLWAEKNHGPVWLSTYTKNLQRQIDQELDQLYPEPAQKWRKTVVRKGRENYLCLLNLAEATARSAAQPASRIALGLIARWARVTRDGDMVGGDLPSWLAARLRGGEAASGLTDRRGECIYAACAHYRKCFIERVIRRARSADLVIANHALVMIHAALGDDDGQAPSRYVFDEGHHLFAAADSAFSAHLTGQETAELRRWLRGPESARRRGRGLETRIGDLLGEDAAALQNLRETLAGAGGLPGEGWLSRLREGAPRGPSERFFARLRDHVRARTTQRGEDYSLEAPLSEPAGALLAAANDLGGALASLGAPMSQLVKQLRKRLAEDPENLDSGARGRLEAAIRSLTRRAELITTWRTMLDALKSGPTADFVDWSQIERITGREIDIGLHRHWLDPTAPFAEAVLTPAHGVCITSATLRDSPPEASDNQDEDAWRSAEMRTGAHHLVLAARRASAPSPFDYPGRTRVLVVRDVQRDDIDQVAGAYAALFRAAGGGGLGLFTAISRLRQVHQRIAGPLEDAGLALYAQHVDGFDVGNLVDIFRAETDACLLGTDAVRDGVDVPGRALRLIVFDRVPWPRPDLLHRARKAAFGGPAYDDMLTRLKLKQAYGRLMRRQTDAGVFIMLDARTPSRLLGAFPPGVAIERVGLKQAIETTAAFLAQIDDATPTDMA